MINLIKKLAIILIVGIFILSYGVCNVAVAATGEEQLSEAVENLNNGPSGDDDDPYKILSDVMGILGWSGFLIAIFKITQIGINFMTGIGSRRANAKDSILPWALGCVICAMFGTLGPWFISLIASADSGDVFSALFFLF